MGLCVELSSGTKLSLNTSWMGRQFSSLGRSLCVCLCNVKFQSSKNLAEWKHSWSFSTSRFIFLIKHKLLGSPLQISNAAERNTEVKIPNFLFLNCSMGIVNDKNRQWSSKWNRKKRRTAENWESLAPSGMLSLQPLVWVHLAQMMSVGTQLLLGSVCSTVVELPWLAFPAKTKHNFSMAYLLYILKSFEISSKKIPNTFEEEKRLIALQAYGGFYICILHSLEPKVKTSDILKCWPRILC